jgi:hypothetical protein
MFGSKKCQILKFPDGWSGGLRRIPSMGEVWIIDGTTQLRKRLSLFFYWMRFCPINGVQVRDCKIKYFLKFIANTSKPQPLTRNQDLWAGLKARQKDGQISLAVENCSFQMQSPTHAQSNVVMGHMYIMWNRVSFRNKQQWLKLSVKEWLSLICRPETLFSVSDTCSGFQPI